jgi:hypothetical protein
VQIKTSRRTFFRYSLDELVGVFDETRGKPSFKLSTLATLNDEQLGSLVPAITDASNVSGRGDHFVVTLPDGQAEVLFGVNSKEEDVWSRIDGRASLRHIADALALEWDETRATAFARARSVFLQLASKRICVPCNPLQ